MCVEEDDSEWGGGAGKGKGNGCSAELLKLSRPKVMAVTRHRTELTSFAPGITKASACCQYTRKSRVAGSNTESATHVFHGRCGPSSDQRTQLCDMTALGSHNERRSPTKAL